MNAVDTSIVSPCLNVLSQLRIPHYKLRILEHARSIENHERFITVETHTYRKGKHCARHDFVTNGSVVRRSKKIGLPQGFVRAESLEIQNASFVITFLRMGSPREVTRGIAPVQDITRIIVHDDCDPRTLYRQLFRLTCQKPSLQKKRIGRAIPASMQLPCDQIIACHGYYYAFFEGNVHCIGPVTQVTRISLADKELFKALETLSCFPVEYDVMSGFQGVLLYSDRAYVKGHDLFVPLNVGETKKLLFGIRHPDGIGVYGMQAYRSCERELTLTPLRDQAVYDNKSISFMSPFEVTTHD